MKLEKFIQLTREIERLEKKINSSKKFSSENEEYWRKKLWKTTFKSARG